MTARSRFRLLLLALAVSLPSCGRPPEPGGGPDAVPGESAPVEAKRIPSGATLRDSLDDPHPMPQDALVVDSKPWDLDYELGRYGGNLTFGSFSEPKTFNWVVSNESSSSDVYHRMYSDLVHVNRWTQEAELALAKSFVVAPDGLSMTVELRQGILWSDGQPFTADDVVFTWDTLFDPDVRSPQADLLTVGEKPIKLEKLGDFSVRANFPAAIAVPERLLDSIYVLPKHKLADAVKNKTFTSALGVGMDPADFVTLGPFRLKAYQAGIKTVLERNPHFWKYDRQKRRLPYLDEITFVSVPDWNAERLKFENLELHIPGSQVRQEDFAGLKKLEAAKDWTVYDLGPSLNINFLWFNQNQAATTTLDDHTYMIHPDGTVREQSRTVTGAEKAKVLKAPSKPLVDPVKLAWFRDTRFRRAVSHAINREGIIRSSFYGLGVPLHSALSQGNKFWHNPNVEAIPYDPALAAKLLDEAGYQDRDGDGKREDASGHPIEFTLYTNKGNEAREKMGTIIKDDLSKVGIVADFKPIDFNALITKVSSTYDYEAGILSLGGGDVDPMGGLNVWKSSGFTHFWYPLEAVPATDWEREIDALLVTVQTAQDRDARRQASWKMQEILAREQPLNFLLSVKQIAAARNCIGNLRPTIMDHYTLHNQEFLYFKY